jgi:hypothetical protein
MAEQAAIEVKGSSRLLMSVSELYSSQYKGYVHGDYQMEQGAFDKTL